MGRLRLLLLALVLAAPQGTPASARARPAAERREAGRGAAAAKQQRPARPTLAEAKAALTALTRDHDRRRFRHNWERAIAGLLAAAHGKDAPAATLEAARARYALYRWSANEADREEALALAARAARLGSREAASLAVAIRREAGDERPSAPVAAKAPARAPPSGGQREPRAQAEAPRSAASAPPGPAGAPARAPPAPAPSAAAAALAAIRGTSPAAPAPALAIGATPAPAAEPHEEDAADPDLEAALGDLSPEAARPRPLGASAGQGPARVSQVRSWSSADYTRVAIYLSHWVGWQKLELPAEGDRPRRLAIDLRPAVLEGKALAQPVPGDQVERVRAAQNDPETVRVVLDLAGEDAVQLFSLDDPPRLIVDVGASRPEPAVAVASPDGGGAAAVAPRPGGETVSRDPDLGARGPIRRIVVDAGHGGHDPGAIGPTRVREKDVTLAIARRVARKLRDAGFEVVLTRSDDRYLALEERTAIANTARGDLFVSIHANAHPKRNRAGIETYFLNVADDRYAARLAARENGAASEGGAEVVRILTDLDAKASAGASRRLAHLVQQEVCAGVRSRIGEVRDIGVKSALFYVLLGARMPAVLVEAGFISNREEERRLASSRYQEEVAAGVARAVTAFARADARIANR